MSILIKGIKMPKACMNGGCPIDGKYCDLWWKAGGSEYGRHPRCPLIEIQDHGDLIDRDALKNELMDIQYAIPDPLYGGAGIEMAYRAIAQVKTVIPAERSGE